MVAGVAGYVAVLTRGCLPVALLVLVLVRHSGIMAHERNFPLEEHEHWRDGEICVLLCTVDFVCVAALLYSAVTCASNFLVSTHECLHQLCVVTWVLATSVCNSAGRAPQTAAPTIAGLELRL